MWHLWRMAQAYSRRPSELLGITDPWVAWQVDAATHAGGTTVDAEVSKAEAAEAGKNHPQIERAVKRALERVLGVEERRRRESPEPVSTWRYDPAAWAAGELVPVSQVPID